jgi:lysophospholipase L1-like esterase
LRTIRMSNALGLHPSMHEPFARTGSIKFAMTMHAILEQRWLKLAAIGLIALLVMLTGLVMTVLVYQANCPVTGNPQYVALGSSFAAGIGLGPRAPRSPFVCMRSINGYPQQLARMLRLSLVDMSCSGATTEHVLRGGQFFQRPQLDALDRNTELVTITTGGNDVRYVGDLSFLAARSSGSIFGRALRWFWKGPLRPEERNFAKLHLDFVAMLAEIHRRSPTARVVVVSYPMILPPAGICGKLGVSVEEAEMMRQVGDRLAEVTRTAAQQGAAIVVDMHDMGSDHHACSVTPWVNGWREAEGTQFHPTLLGAKAAADAIASALRKHP